MWGWTLGLAVIACIVMMVWPKWRVDRPLISIGLHLAVAAPFVALASRFIVNDTDILHVALNGGEDLPLKYRFAATWAAREGPLLMWAAWMGLVAWWFGRPLASEQEHTHKLRLRLMYGFTLLLILISMTLNPFADNPYDLRGTGLNELLQTDLMVIHPPLVFLAYSLCIALAATSVSILQYGDDEDIDKRMLHQTRPGILIATLGIGLGGLWAYMVLDWGGYWAWDPVETGSFLPWLALVLMGHLRTRPGKTSTLMWTGLGLAAGALALFATLVTRAGGVWAASVHTFVVKDEGTPPTDVFSRMLLLKDEAEGVEIVSYVLVILLLCGVFIRATQGQTKRPLSYLFFIPIVGAAIAVLFDYASYEHVPALFFVGVVFAPTLVEWPKKNLVPEEDVWSYRGYLSLPWLLIVPLVAYVLTQDLLFTLLNALIFAPLYTADDARKAWGWGAAGTMMCLAAAWSGLVDLYIAAILLGFYILPWLVMGEEEAESVDWLSRRFILRLALWAPVVLTSLYLVLTLVILISSIDAIQFEAHELYGAPFIMALALAMFAYTSRHQSPQRIVSIVVGVALVSILLATFLPSALGGDASEPISEYLSRGTIAWLVLPSVLVAVVPMGAEVVRRVQTSGVQKIAPAAHLVHFGLLLLLIGHVFTTVLVDRGDASHRITLVRGEYVEVGDYEYVFEEIVLDDDLEVGDRYVGAVISVYEDGEKIGTVQPGLIGFDRSPNPPRSEVDTLVRSHGDIVFIFDGSQSSSMMQQVQSDGEESVQRMRVIIYDLPASHLVWAGWAIMMIGMAWLTVLDVRQTPHIKAEEE